MIPIETQIFRLIFPPSGSIPLEKLEAVPHIRQHINSIIDLASTEHGVATPSESAALTARVIELRDTPGPDGKVRTWRTIAEICGTTLDAVRHRYDKGRKSRTVEDAALSGYDIKDKLAEFIEGPTAEVDRPGGPPTESHNHTRAFNERIAIGHVEPLLIDMGVSESIHPCAGGEAIPGEGECTKISSAVTLPNIDRAEWKLEAPKTAPIEDKPDEVATTGLTPCQRGQLIGPKIPHELDDEIIMLREAGNPLKEIVNHLQVLGVTCTESDVSARVISEQKKRAAAKKVEEATVQEAAEPATQDGTDEGPQEAEATNDRPKPVSMSRKELDLQMWDLHKAGKTLDEISDILYSKGLYYSPKSVRVRLLSQGAKL